MGTLIDKVLTENGFERIDNNLLIYEKKSENISLFVVERSSNKYPKKKAVELGIGVNDPFLANQNSGLAVSVFVSEKGVSSRKEEDVIWWDFPKEEAEFVSLFLDQGVRWFAEFSETKNLIQYFEKGVISGISDPPPKKSFISALGEKLLFRNSSLMTNEVRKPPIFNYYLSVLYYTQGDFQNSKKFSENWHEFVKIRPDEIEPERTIKQLEKINLILSEKSKTTKL